MITITWQLLLPYPFLGHTRVTTVISGNDHYYMATAATMNWSDADSLATSKGGYLVSIQSQAENDFLQTTFFPATPEAFWIGLHRIVPHLSNFVWISGESVGYTNWSSGEPNDYSSGVGGANGEPCVAINWYYANGLSAARGNWNDTPNGGTAPMGAALQPYRAIIEFNSNLAAYTTVSGNITLEACNDPEQAITFEFRPKPSGTVFKRKVLLTQSGPNSGTFSLPNIPKGTYDIAVKGFCWLQKVLPNVVVNGDVSGLSASLLTADLNNDNSVDSSDFGLLIGDYGAIGDL